MKRPQTNPPINVCHLAFVDLIQGQASENVVISIKQKRKIKMF